MSRLHRLWAVPVVALAAALPLLEADDDAPKGRQYALLVGVKSYKKGELKSLKYTENDVNDLADVLRDAGYKRVVVMTQAAAADDQDLAPTAQNIREQLRSLLEDRRPGDTVLVAFSGHGVQFKGQDDHYFCPADARLADRNTLLSLSEVYDALKACKAEMKLLVVDACRADPQPDNKGPAKVDLESVTRPQAERPPGGVAALFSCSEGQFAYESDALKHGVFFHYLIEGMRGEAANKKGEVTLERLASYVKDEVPDRVKDEEGPGAKQQPHFVGDVVGETPLAAAGERDMKETSYFPTRVGTTWTYKGTRTDSMNGGAEQTSEYKAKVLKHRKIGDMVCAPILWTVDGREGTTPMYYCVKDDGVFEAVLDGPEIKHLGWKLRLPPETTPAWEDSGLYAGLKMIFSEKAGQDVTVAGKQYSAVAVTREYATQISKVTATTYFAKGVGEVKYQERLEHMGVPGQTAGVSTFVKELEKFDPRGK